MKAIWARIQAEPALVSGFVAAVLALATAFGLNLTGDQIGTILAIVTAGLALLVRSQVTPTATVVAQAVAGTVVAGPASAVATGAPVEVWPAGAPVAPDPTPPA